MRIDEPTGIAVIPIHGTLMRRALGLHAASGLTFSGEIGAMLIGDMPAGSTTAARKS